MQQRERGCNRAIGGDVVWLQQGYNKHVQRWMQWVTSGMSMGCSTAAAGVQGQNPELHPKQRRHSPLAPGQKYEIITLEITSAPE